MHNIVSCDKCHLKPTCIWQSREYPLTLIICIYTWFWIYKVTHIYLNRSQILSLTEYFSYLIKIMTQIDFYHRTYTLMYSQDCDNWTTNEIRILFEVRDCGSRKIIAKYKYSNHPHMLPQPQAPVGANTISCNEWRELLWLLLLKKKGK